MATSASDAYQQSVQNLGRSAESYLGTEKARTLGIPYRTIPGGVDVTGTLTTQRGSEESARGTDLMNQSIELQKLNTNQ